MVAAAVSRRMANDGPCNDLVDPVEQLWRRLAVGEERPRRLAPMPRSKNPATGSVVPTRSS